MFLSRIAKIFYREFQIVTKDPVLVSILFLTPIVYTIFFGCLYEEKRVLDIPVYVIDEDRTETSGILKRNMAQNEYIRIASETKTLDEFISDTHYEKAFGCLIIPEGFEKNVKKGKPGDVAALIEGSNMIVANSLSKGFAETAGAFGAGVEIKRLTKKGTPVRHALTEAMPVSASVRMLNNPTLNYLDFLVPGLVGTVVQQVTLLSVAMAISREREKGLAKRIREISSSAFEILAGKSAFYTFVNFCTASVAYGLIFRLFGVKFAGDLWPLVLLLFLFTAALVSFGIMISSILKDSVVIMEALMMLAVPSFLASGYTWPQFAMTKPILAISQALPLTHFVLPMKQIIILGAPYDAIRGHLTFLIILTAIGYAGAYLCISGLIRSGIIEEASRPSETPAKGDEQGL